MAKSKGASGMWAVLGLVGLVFSLNAKASVWENTKSWTADEELKYSAWVQTNWTPTIFTEGRYRGIATDCAKAGYTMRMIYSYENGLPFEINDPTTNSKTARITNLKTTFDTVTNNGDLRFRKFNDYVKWLVSTSSVPNDTYSPVVNRKSVRPGGLFLFYTFHTYEIQDVSGDGIPHLLNSTEPYEVRRLAQTDGFPTFDFAWDLLDYPNGGIRMFRWPEQIKMSIAEMTQLGLWSNQQYDMRAAHQGGDWADEVHGLLSIAGHETTKAKASRMFKNLTMDAELRVAAVDEGVGFHQSVGRKLTSVEYDQYSTPERDAKLLSRFTDFLKAQNAWIADAAQANTGEQIQDPEAMLKVSVIVWAPGKTMTFQEIYDRLKPGSVPHLSSDPNDSLEDRWGQPEGAATQASPPPTPTPSPTPLAPVATATPTPSPTPAH